MAVDQIRYDILAQDALRGVVRKVLADAAKKGLPGEHHFFITFDTHAAGVRLSARMRERYPQEMTIVLQHQFWDLKVADDHFEVGLSFGGVPEKLLVPFAAIKSFVDPSTQFGLQFETLGDDAGAVDAPVQGNSEQATERRQDKPQAKARTPERHEAPPATEPSAAPPLQAVAKTPDDPDKRGAEVVRLDRFRKK